MSTYDAAVVGSGPNGLAAAIVLARAGRSVIVFEANRQIGGGARTQELTLPGFRHDVCSAIHPMGAGSPFFKSLPLEQHGLTWIHPPVPLAHPLDREPPCLLKRSVEATAEMLGDDRPSYIALMKPFAQTWDRLAADALGPLSVPRSPLLLARFGLKGLRSADGLARSLFKGQPARALFAGISAHSMLRLEQVASAAIGLILAIAGHTVGWPMPRGGSQQITEALASYLRSLGGKIETEKRIQTLAEIPTKGPILFDTSPATLSQVVGDDLPLRFRRRLSRYRYGPGVFKLDWALNAPIPWRFAECAQAGTLHLGGTLEEIAAGERAVASGQHPDRPFVLLAQQSLFDDTRAPAGKHTAWAYCHVPPFSSRDMTQAIEAQVERFAPGFRDVITARHTFNCLQIEEHNANYVGGDINCGSPEFSQLFFRPTFRVIPYSTPNPRVFLCSAATPPGGGVHGMCGFHAAKAALRRWPSL
jgi:phytoene dehydrogenase-like protein